GRACPRRAWARGHVSCAAGVPQPMKVPLRWLRDYVDLPASVPQLAERLTLAGLEVASVRLLGLPAPTDLRLKVVDAGPVWDPAKIVIGQVLAVERHPN